MADGTKVGAGVVVVVLPPLLLEVGAELGTSLVINDDIFPPPLGIILGIILGRSLGTSDALLPARGPGLTALTKAWKRRGKVGAGVVVGPGVVVGGNDGAALFVGAELTVGCIVGHGVGLTVGDGVELGAIVGRGVTVGERLAVGVTVIRLKMFTIILRLPSWVLSLPSLISTPSTLFFETRRIESNCRKAVTVSERLFLGHTSKKSAFLFLASSAIPVAIANAHETIKSLER